MILTWTCSEVRRFNAKNSNDVRFFVGKSQEPHARHKLNWTPTGIMFTRADRIGIDSVEDLKDVVIGALAISDFAGGQAQFYIMHEYGLDYIVDPKQVIFTGAALNLLFCRKCCIFV